MTMKTWNGDYQDGNRAEENKGDDYMKTTDIKFCIYLSRIEVSGHIYCDNITISNDDVLPDSLIFRSNYNYIACFNLSEYELVYVDNISNIYYYSLVRKQY